MSASRRAWRTARPTIRAWEDLRHNPSDYFLRCRILDRILRFLRPTLRRPLPLRRLPIESAPFHEKPSSRFSNRRGSLLQGAAINKRNLEWQTAGVCRLVLASANARRKPAGGWRPTFADYRDPLPWRTAGVSRLVFALTRSHKIN